MKLNRNRQPKKLNKVLRSLFHMSQVRKKWRRMKKKRKRSGRLGTGRKAGLKDHHQKKGLRYLNPYHLVKPKFLKES